MQVQRTETIRSVQAVADADGLPSRAGTALLVGLADRVGLTGALSRAMGGVRRRRSRHDPGWTLRDLAVMLADGGGRGGGGGGARAPARERVWELAGAPRRVILDLDATLVSAHSDKEQAAGNYKHGFGFHPLLCYEAKTQEALAGILRPGNAGAITAADHTALLGVSIAQLPAGTRGPGLLVRA